MKVRTTHVVAAASVSAAAVLLLVAFVTYRRRQPPGTPPRWPLLLPFHNNRTRSPRQPPPPLDPLVHGLVLWSSDFHISPVADIKHVVGPYGVHVVDKSLSGHCHLTNTCERDLKVINTHNGIALGPCPNRLRTAFHEAYRQDAQVRTAVQHLQHRGTRHYTLLLLLQMLAVDAFLCLHATAMCELYMPFNRSLIAIASTRYLPLSHATPRQRYHPHTAIRSRTHPS